MKLAFRTISAVAIRVFESQVNLKSRKILVVTNKQRQMQSISKLLQGEDGVIIILKIRFSLLATMTVV